MIWLYTGTPGSGKSYHVCCDVIQKLKRGGNVIANFPVNENVIKRCKGRSTYIDNQDLTPKYLIDYAMQHHEFGKENQTLVVIDECQIMFNAREFGRKDRREWVTFFSQHRKLGYNVILITQADKMLDKQIRALCETEIKHRKMNNYGFAGMVFSLFCGGTVFIAIEYWYGGNKMKISQQLIKYKKRNAAVYDSYRMFSDVGEAAPGVTVPGMPAEPAGAPGNGAPERSDHHKKSAGKKKRKPTMEPAPQAQIFSDQTLDAFNLDAIMKEFSTNSA